MKHAFIYSRGKFLELSSDFLKDKAIIRIHNVTDYEWYKQETNQENCLELFFDDLGESQISFLDKWIIKLNLKFKTSNNPLNLDQAKQIIKFIEKNNGKDFVIHCEYGRSRSVAVALYLKEYFQYEIMNKTKEELSHPNTWVSLLLRFK
mgnify:FL=1